MEKNRECERSNRPMAHNTYVKKKEKYSEKSSGWEKKKHFSATSSVGGSQPYRNAREKEQEVQQVRMGETLSETVDESENTYGEDRGLVVGRNAVRELLKSGKPIDKLYVSGREGSITVLVAEAKKRGIPVVDAEMPKLDQLSGGEHHQGIVAQTAAREYVSLQDILEIAQSRGERPLIVVCDGVEDPHNLGAIIRCAECCGAHGVVIPKRRACGVTAAVAKASAGAVEHMAIARVQNIASAVDDLKKMGIWTFAAEAGGTDFWESDFRTSCAIVLGSEGNGVSRLVRERCDFIVSIPMYGAVNSLNVSTAASILLCHAARMQRSAL